MLAEALYTLFLCHKHAAQNWAQCGVPVAAKTIAPGQE